MAFSVCWLWTDLKVDRCCLFRLLMLTISCLYRAGPVPLTTSLRLFPFRETAKHKPWQVYFISHPSLSFLEFLTSYIIIVSLKNVRFVEHSNVHVTRVARCSCDLNVFFQEIAVYNSLILFVSLGNRGSSLVLLCIVSKLASFSTCPCIQGVLFLI